MNHREAFLKFHRENPQIYELFKSEAFRAIDVGHKKFSAKMIIESIRWKRFLLVGGKEKYKLNNNYTAHYARMFQEDYPRYREVFQNRRRNIEDRNIFIEPGGQTRLFMRMQVDAK